MRCYSIRKEAYGQCIRYSVIYEWVEKPPAKSILSVVWVSDWAKLGSDLDQTEYRRCLKMRSYFDGDQFGDLAVLVDEANNNHASEEIRD